MFRKMRRFKQELSKEECMEILKNEPRGVLSVLGDDGYPYVSFCVYDKGYRKENDWALNIKSVIVFGRVRFVEDQDTINQICTNMCDKFTDDKEYAKVELSKCGSSVLCLELNPEHITGKLVNES